MNREQLEIAKKIATIEGVYFNKEEILFSKGKFLFPVKIRTASCFYNPFDWKVLGPLMVKYRVSINHSEKFVFINRPTDYSASYFYSANDIPRAILECILKINGKYED